MERVPRYAEGTINAFVNEHKKVQDSKASLLLADFKATAKNPSTAPSRGDIAEAPSLRVAATGQRSLRDAIMQAIIVTGTKLSKMSESMRPGTVIFICQTDGQENASREFSQEQVIEAMLKRHEDQFKWTFIFLATGPDAFSFLAFLHGVPGWLMPTPSAAEDRVARATRARWITSPPRRWPSARAHVSRMQHTQPTSTTRAT